MCLFLCLQFFSCELGKTHITSHALPPKPQTYYQKFSLAWTRILSSSNELERIQLVLFEGKKLSFHIFMNNFAPQITLIGTPLEMRLLLNWDREISSNSVWIKFYPLEIVWEWLVLVTLFNFIDFANLEQPISHMESDWVVCVQESDIHVWA